MKTNNLITAFISVILLLCMNISKAETSPVEYVLRGEKNYETQKIQPFKDNNEKLYSVVGKTQLIKFDEPVKRISITEPSLADVVLLSPKELLLNGKKAGRTSLVFWGDSDKPIFFNLIVQQDTDAFVQAVSKIAPNEDIHYTFTDDGVIMTGHISSTTVKKNIEEIIKAYNIKLLDLTESCTKQVLLEVKITEASRNFTKSLQSSFSVGEYNFNTFNPGQGLVNTFNNIVSGASTGTAQGGSFVLSSSSAKLAWNLQAAETKGLIKILAEPKLLAVDGQPGSFNVGQEIPYPASVGLSSTTSYSFKNTGVILNFTPTILEKSNRILLKLTPEISEIDSSYSSSSGVPGFKTRKVDTTVELGDGETLIIAGLLKHRSSNSKDQVPLLGDIPVLGFLFSGMKSQKEDTELVIFITPKIVEVENNGINL